MLPLLKSTAKSSLIYSLGNISTKVAGFLLIPLYTKYLPLADYGVLGLMEVISLAITAIFSLSLYSGFARLYYDKEFIGKQNSIFFTSVTALLSICLLLVIFLKPFSNHLSDILFKQDYSSLFNYMIVVSAFLILTSMPSILLRLQEKPFLFISTNIVRLILTLFFTFVFMVHYKHGLKGIYEAQLIANIIYLICLLPFMIRNFEYKFEFRALKQMLSFSLPLVLGSISVIIISFTDKYLLNVMKSLSDSGLYSFSFKISNTIYYLIVDSVNLALAPIFYKIMYDKNSQRFYSKIVTYLSFMVLVCIMALSFFGKELIELISSNKAYYIAYKVMPVLTFAALFMLLKDAMIRALNIVKKSRIISIVIFCVSFANILLNFALIPVLMTTGASLAYFLTQVLAFVMLYFFAQKAYPIPYELKKIAIMFILAVFLTAGAFMLNHLPILPAIALKLLLLGSFPIILYFFNFYEKIELQRMREILTGKTIPVETDKGNL
jgi:O-antigen/teichoic acid export membrane protein